jgi:hypothetical protein
LSGVGKNVDETRILGNRKSDRKMSVFSRKNPTEYKGKMSFQHFDSPLQQLRQTLINKKIFFPPLRVGK